MSAGSFVSVPVVWAAWLLRAPALIHQQDARPGLANKLMAPFAKVITVAFKKSLDDYGKKAIWVGNPVRKELRIMNYELRMLRERFGLDDKLPVILIIGGGTGAMAINKLVWESLDKLTEFCQIIHITGKGKKPNYQLPITNYKDFEFLDTMAMTKTYAAADIVVSRCGMGVLTELSYLGKPTILIPMPNSHQEDNARVFKEVKAAIILDQNKLTPRIFVDNIKKMLADENLRNKLSYNIKNVIKKDAGNKIIEIINKILK